MVSLLIAIIYLAFISLGLPDSLLGSAWPVMRVEFDASLSAAGIVSMIIAGGTVISSLMSDFMTRKLGTGLITVLSVALTAFALFGFSLSTQFWMLCLWAIPYGLGAGAVDAALNNYVALHYASRHMSWLHCFWGVGASISPYIMSACLADNGNWPLACRIVSLLQVIITIVLFLALPLWKKKQAASPDDAVPSKPLGLVGALRIKGVPYMLLAFFCYSVAECTVFFWAASYLVEYRGIAEATAAQFASLAYLGITAGRFFNGFIADKVGDRNLIRLGGSIMLLGAVMIMLPLPTDFVALAGLLVIGVGCSPVYPSIIHSTPTNFGAENSQAIVGIQMASAYTATTFFPPLFGVIANAIGIWLYPFWVGAYILLMFAASEKLNRKIK